jgi:hypothetical protein
VSNKIVDGFHTPVIIPLWLQIFHYVIHYTYYNSNYLVKLYIYRVPLLITKYNIEDIISWLWVQTFGSIFSIQDLKTEQKELSISEINDLENSTI